MQVCAASGPGGYQVSVRNHTESSCRSDDMSSQQSFPASFCLAARMTTQDFLCLLPGIATILTVAMEVISQGKDFKHDASNFGSLRDAVTCRAVSVCVCMCVCAVLMTKDLFVFPEFFLTFQAGGQRRPIELCPTKLPMVSSGYWD